MSYLNVYDTEAAWQLVHALGDGPDRRRHQARQPLRRRGGRRHPHRLHPGPRVRSGVGLRRHRGGEPPGHHGRGRGPRARLHRGAGRPGLRARRAGVPEGEEEEPAHPGGARRRRCPSCPLRSIDGGLPGADAPTSSPSTAAAWTVATERAADRGRVGRPRARPGGSSPRSRRTPSCWSRTAPPSASAAASRTGATPAAWRGRRRPVGPSAASTPPTRSSRSPTGWRAPSTPGPRAWCSPGGSIRDDEVIAAADDAGLAMVFTGERHFRH